MEEFAKYEAMGAKKFATHKATKVVDDARYLIVDWRREDGCGDYYINFIVDKKRGAFIVSGDLGDSIAVWYNPVAVEDMSSWIYNDIGYYISKIQCSSNLYTYDEDDILADIMEYLGEEGVESLLENNPVYENIDELKEALMEDIGDSLYERNTFIPSSGLIELLCEDDPDYWEWLPNCGKRIDGRVYLWAIGFKMALDQLGMI